ncbi:MAG: hypothetical protein FWB94_10160 [Chitinispirillia bacterium]|nr:hypothetical protein [Chitinispirillia bacterium]
MKRVKILIVMAIFTLSLGAFAQQGTPSASDIKADSAAVRQSATVSAQKPAASQNKQASVNRPTKKTNWSKIKTLFE